MTNYGNYGNYSALRDKLVTPINKKSASPVIAVIAVIAVFWFLGGFE